MKMANKQNADFRGWAAVTGAATLAMASILSGCGTGLSGGAASTAAPVALTINGVVHGGQNPVSGATIQMYTVGTTGLQTASTTLLPPGVTTNSSGGFGITGMYNNCAGATQVYIVATGGNAGGGTNSAISLMAALGACSSLQPTTNILINEVTTVAAAYALAPFATDYAHIGANGSNPAGLVGAFANAAVLANFSSGATPGSGLAAGVTVPNAEINSLANILAACINSTGASFQVACTTMQSATGASDTFGHALAFAKNPGSAAIVGLFNLSTQSAPFQPTIGTAPADFSVAVSTTGNATLATPFGIAIDASGNAWVTNESGTSVTELSGAGSVLASPTATGLAGPQGIAIDKMGNVWVANTAGNSVIEFGLTSGAVTSTNSYTAGGSVTGPTAIAINSAGSAFVTNLNGNSVTGITSAGATIGTGAFTGNGNISAPQGIAIDPTGNLYVTSGNGTIVKLTSAGAYSASLTDNTLQGPSAVAVDSSSRVLATGFTTGSAVGGALSQFTSAGTPVSLSPFTSGLSSPTSVATDGTSIWAVNGVTSGGLAQFSYASSTPLSPGAGYGSLNTPDGVAIDATGSVWTTNGGNNTVSKYIGIASPVVTPLAANVGP